MVLLARGIVVGLSFIKLLGNPTNGVLGISRLTANFFCDRHHHVVTFSLTTNPFPTSCKIRVFADLPTLPIVTLKILTRLLSGISSPNLKPSSSISITALACASSISLSQNISRWKIGRFNIASASLRTIQSRQRRATTPIGGMSDRSKLKLGCCFWVMREAHVTTALKSGRNRL